MDTAHPTHIAHTPPANTTQSVNEGHGGMDTAHTCAPTLAKAHGTKHPHPKARTHWGEKVL